MPPHTRAFAAAASQYNTPPHLKAKKYPFKNPNIRTGFPVNTEIDKLSNI
jgi:hypothetical protein